MRIRISASCQMPCIIVARFWPILSNLKISSSYSPPPPSFSSSSVAAASYAAAAAYSYAYAYDYHLVFEEKYTINLCKLLVFCIKSLCFKCYL